MNQDVMLLLSSLFFCLLFIFCHGFLSHVFIPQSSPVVFVKTLFVSWIITNIIATFLSILYLYQMFTVFLLSLFFFMNLWIAVYCLGIALTMYASIHVKVFRIIGKKQRVSVHDFSSYTDYQIVKTHVDSLIASNALKKQKNSYEMGNSYLIKIYTCLSSGSETLFPVKQL